MGRPQGHRQNDVLRFLYAFMADNGFAPTYDEIRRAVGLSSRSHVAYYLDALEEGGLIERVGRRPRGVRLVGPVPDAAGVTGSRKPGTG